VPRRSTLLISFLACLLLDAALQACRCADIRAVVPAAAEHRRAAHCADRYEAGVVIKEGRTSCEEPQRAGRREAAPAPDD
jgi:hypothetical protein